MKGQILNIDGRWFVQTTFLLSEEDVNEIKNLEQRFDNIESRILSSPNVNFEIKDGKAKLNEFASTPLDENDYPLLGVFNQNSIIFESDLDKKIFFDALDQPDEPNQELIEAKEYYLLFQYIKNKINNISLDNMQNDPCLFGKYATYMEIIEFLNKKN